MKRLAVLGVGKGSLGYTIVEALIFLAVSGALLISAGSIINGRQERARFAQAIDDIGVSLQDYFNDASTGFYPSSESITCNPSGSSYVVVTGSSPQGTNVLCVFAGKLIEFPINSTSYSSYTLVANRTATSLPTATVRILGKGSNPGIAQTKSNNIDLRTTRIIQSPSGPNFSSIVAVSDFGSVSGGVVSGNASQLRLYGYIPATSSGNLVTNNPAQLVPITNNSSIVVCLRQDGGGNRVGSLRISPQLTIDRRIGSQEAVCTT